MREGVLDDKVSSEGEEWKGTFGFSEHSPPTLNIKHNEPHLCERQGEMRGVSGIILWTFILAYILSKLRRL